jgi:hypothetical protein
MPAIYQFIAHHQPDIQYDPEKHMDKKEMFRILADGVGIITVLENKELVNYRVTLKNSLVIPSDVLTTNPDDVCYWLFDLETQEWKYFDIKNVKHFEKEMW